METKRREAKEESGRGEGDDERLLGEKKMGRLFKVLFASNNKKKFNLGFK